MPTSSMLTTLYAYQLLNLCPASFVPSNDILTKRRERLVAICEQKWYQLFLDGIIYNLF